MRVLLCGGGSAGHVNPAIAIAQTILKNAPESKVAYVATISGIENELVDYKKYHIDVSGLKRKLSMHNVKSIYKTIKATKKSKEIIKDFCPDIIVGTGGYATFPVVSAGHKLGIKTVLHESNVYPGKAIKMLESKADIIFTNFESSREYFKKKEKILYVGNPLRHGFSEYNKIELKKNLGIKEKFVILCYGGSLGAEKINKTALEIIENYVRYHSDVRFILATGKRCYYEFVEKMKQRRLDKLKNISVYEYIKDMPQKMAIADVVISRAGAMTISELAAMGKCSILIPSPNVADNHQLKNAKELEAKNAAIVVTEDKTYKITDIIKELLINDKKREKREENIKQFYRSDANKDIYQKIVELIKN
jgi:UDP-N-acetylglucosamine--N-acetylmuramyl-(pentapeptide) pyrophosphoryl-undecaprenol N-acetylglucosamine transferase